MKEKLKVVDTCVCYANANDKSYTFFLPEVLHLRRATLMLTQIKDFINFYDITHEVVKIR